jgi:Caspase domain
VPGRRLALLVATYRYQDAGLRQLTAPGHDAEALAEVLRDPQIADFEVTTLINEPHHVVGDAIGEFYHNRRRDDLTLLYFTGHGLKDDQGRLYLAMADTKRDRLFFSALSARQIDEAIESCWSRQKILILDCCYSGAFSAGWMPKADSQVHTLEKFQGKGRVVLTASDSTQYSFEENNIIGEGSQSVFTRFLVEGLTTGKADLDSDGDISLDELYSYVHERVIEEMPQQRPKKQEDIEGRIVIARNINWRLPAHIRDAIESPFMQHRLAALEGLAHLHRVGNEVVRAEVISQTRRLIHDDSRAVSTAAMKLITALDPDLTWREAEDRARRVTDERTWREVDDEWTRRETKKPSWVPAVSTTSPHNWPEEGDERQVVTSPSLSTAAHNTPVKGRQPGPEAEAGQHNQVEAATKTPTFQHVLGAAEEEAGRKPHRWTARSKWLVGLLRGTHENHAQQKAERQSVRNTQADGHPGLLNSWGLGRLTRRQTVLAASAALLIIPFIALAIVLVVISSHSATAKVNSADPYVYKSPSLVAPTVRQLKYGTEVAIQCITQGDKVAMSSLWYRIDEGYIPAESVDTERNQATLPNC